MLFHHLSSAIRNIRFNKTFSIINILGLAIGMAACLLIFQYVRFETSYDDFNKNGKNIYRLTDATYQHGKLLSENATTVPALGIVLKTEFPEVVNTTRLIHTKPLMADPVLEYNDKFFFENKIYYAEKAAPEMFALSMSAGDAKTVLEAPQSIILSSSMAKKYFVNEDPIGKTIVFNKGVLGKESLKITGVYENLPENAHFKPEFLISFSSLPAGWNLDQNWDWGNYYVYVELANGIDPKKVEAKIPAMLEKYLGDHLKQSLLQGYKSLLELQPLQSIHLYSDLHEEHEVNGNAKTVLFLTIISIFI